MAWKNVAKLFLSRLEGPAENLLELGEVIWNISAQLAEVGIYLHLLLHLLVSYTLQQTW